MEKAIYRVIDSKKSLTTQDFSKLISLLKELKGIGISEPSGETDSVYMFYENVPFRPKLTFADGKITMETDLTDGISGDVLRPTANKLNLRIYFENIKSLIPRNLSIVECMPSTNEEHLKALKIMEKNNLQPVFNLYRKYVYYAVSNLDGTVHIVNDNMLYHFIKSTAESVVVPEFSYKVADNLADFVRKFDYDLIPFDFYEHYGRSFKIINFSGFDIEKPGRKIFIKPFILEYSNDESDFVKIAGDDSPMLYMDKIRPGETLNVSILRILRSDLKIADDYIGATVAKIVEFDFDKENVLTPRLIVKIYVAKANLSPEQQEIKNRGWGSIGQNKLGK